MSEPATTLYEKYFQGQLAPADTAALKRLLREDDRARAEFAESALEWSLIATVAAEVAAFRREMGTPGAGPQPDDEKAGESRAPRFRTGARPLPAYPLPRPRAAWAWWVTGLAAAVLIAIGLALHVAELRPVSETTAHLAQLEELNGDVVIVARAGERAGRAGANLARGETVRARGPLSAAVLAYPDGTRLELAAGAEITVADGTAAEPGARPLRTRTAGKCLVLRRGRLIASVARQPAGRPMLVATPHAEIKVLGTRFSIDVAPEATEVETREGRVEVTNRKTARSAVVEAGYAARVGTDTLVLKARTGTGQTGERVKDGLVLLYRFREGRGAVVRDDSGYGAPLNLAIQDPDAVYWIPGGGLGVRSPTMIRSSSRPVKIVEACRLSNAITIEAWLKPAHPDQPLDRPAQSPPARIVAVSADIGNADFLLGQEATAYVCRLRTTGTSVGGQPALVTHDDIVRTELTHVAFTRTAAGRVALYVNGAEVSRGQIDQPDPRTKTRGFSESRLVRGTFANWRPEYPLLLANEASGDRPWLGELFLVAIYNRALTEPELLRHYEAGAGTPAARTQARRP
ncbi:MAG: FecR domain-containing protein [Kiritimatiellae bacterium]|nr:FecR domain-containing protein [Kiritimatiellia bacterium]